ncbi:hypothetical protein JG687_00006882, partial [Phytophthora cactorum]
LRLSFLLVVLLLPFVASVQDLTDNDNADLSVNLESTIANNRNLKAAAQLQQV